MYNKQLDAFILTAESGSFSKAAQKAYITPTSLIQQITLLEKHLGVQLFIRSSRGVKLTLAGESVYQDAKSILHFSEIAIERAKAIAEKTTDVIRIGTSLFTKCRYLPDIWNRLIGINPNTRIELIAQKTVETMTQNPLQDLGSKFDLQEGIYISGLYGNKCNFLEICQSPLCAAIPSDHKLYHQKKITLQDLKDDKIVILRKGTSLSFDQARSILINTASNPEIIDVDYYDINIFTTCELNNYILITLKIWSDIHPSMQTCCLDWDCSVPYGLVYSLKPPHQIQQLISIAEESFKK